MLQELQKKLLEHSVSIVVTLLTGLFLLAGKEIMVLLSPQVLDKLPKKAALSLFLLSLLVNCIMCAWVIILYRSRQLTLRFGLYWDKDLNPYCPVCQSPLGAYGDYMTGRGFNCIKCNEIVLITAPDGSNPTLPETIRLLRP